MGLSIPAMTADIAVRICGLFAALQFLAAIPGRVWPFNL
jgi:hypothetical protein